MFSIQTEFPDPLRLYWRNGGSRPLKGRQQNYTTFYTTTWRIQAPARLRIIYKSAYLLGKHAILLGLKTAHLNGVQKVVSSNLTAPTSLSAEGAKRKEVRNSQGSTSRRQHGKILRPAVVLAELLLQADFFAFPVERGLINAQNFEPLRPGWWFFPGLCEGALPPIAAWTPTSQPAAGHRCH